MKRHTRFLLTLITAVVLLQGCAVAVVTGAATGAAALHDRRSTGAVLDDQAIEFRAARKISSEDEVDDQTHISITSYNYRVLLTGEAPTEALRARVVQIVRNVPNVRLVINEIAIAAPSSLTSRGNDTILTAKVKTSLIKIKGFPGFDLTRVKVVTEHSTTYLLGLVTRAEADAVVEMARRISGVTRVVKVFEYLD